jgi:2-C-methyl-D-erythritol 4-phosphate cytidylyltransferase
MKRTAAVIVAAGSGARFGGPKQFALLGGRPLVEWSCAAFQAHPRVEDIILVLPETAAGAEYLRRFPKIRAVAAGVSRLDERRTGVILVHDGARPLVSAGLIDRVIEAAEKRGAAVPAVPCRDTLKEIDGGRVVRTLDRGRLGRVQTPQGFASALLRRALAAASAEGISGTDEAALVERLGEEVAVVSGDPENIKITTPLDLIAAEAIRHENRIGI